MFSFSLPLATKAKKLLLLSKRVLRDSFSPLCGSRLPLATKAKKLLLLSKRALRDSFSPLCGSHLNRNLKRSNLASRPRVSHDNNNHNNHHYHHHRVKKKMAIDMFPSLLIFSLNLIVAAHVLHFVLKVSSVTDGNVLVPSSGNFRDHARSNQFKRICSIAPYSIK